MSKKVFKLDHGGKKCILIYLYPGILGGSCGGGEGGERRKRRGEKQKEKKINMHSEILKCMNQIKICPNY